MGGKGGKAAEKKARFQGTHAETALLLGIGEEALRRAVIQRGCPVLKRGGDGTESLYDWPAVIAWRVKDVVPNDLSVERARLASEQADRVEMDNLERRGLLANVEDVEDRWSAMVLACRAKLLSLARKLAPQLKNVADPNIIAQRITAEVHTALDELADGTAGAGGSRGAATKRNGSVAVAADPEREPVGRRGKAPLS